jgi:hypothetical protein
MAGTNAPSTAWRLNPREIWPQQLFKTKRGELECYLRGALRKEGSKCTQGQNAVVARLQSISSHLAGLPYMKVCYIRVLSQLGVKALEEFVPLNVTWEAQKGVNVTTYNA